MSLSFLFLISCQGQTTESSKTAPQEQSSTTEIPNWKTKYSIQSIETGFGDSSKGWKPVLLLNIENHTNQSIDEYVRVRALFYDTESNTEIGTSIKYLVSKGSPFLPKMNKDLLFFTKTAYKTINPFYLKLRVKLYIKDEFVEDLAIEPLEL